MKVLIAGATGAIGRPLVKQLNDRGHQVVGLCRSETAARTLRDLGAEAVMCDALESEAVRRVVAQAQPGAIVNQLTALSAPLNPRKYIQWLEPTNRLRSEATRSLAEAAVASGTKLLVSQSVGFAYRWEGEDLKSEDDPLIDDQPDFKQAVQALRDLERVTLETDGLEGIVLRYGYFYGPRTSYARDGQIADLVRKRQFPIVGRGTGCFSFIHVTDAAAATVLALERGRPGTYNVVDDEPAEMRAWLPLYADTLGAKPPLRVPYWVARLLAGRFISGSAVHLRGSSNARAKRQLGWQPRWTSWRQGFTEANL